MGLRPQVDIYRSNTEIKVYNRLTSSLVKFWKKYFNLPEKHLEMVKFCQKVHEYLNEAYKLFTKLLRTKETEPTMV